MNKRTEGLNIALYQPWLYVHGGLEKSLLELVSRSRHRWTIYTGHYDAEGTFPEFRQHNVRELKRLSVNRDMGSVLKVAFQIGTQKIPLEDFDCLTICCDGLGDMATFRNAEVPIFNICCTPLRAAFDPVYQEQALQQRGGASRQLFKAFKWCFQQVDRLAWKRYNGVISTSLEVQDRIVRGGLYQKGAQMRLLHPGIDWNDFSGQVTYEPFMLVPGRIMWTKNIELAIDAFKKANLPLPWELVIAGYVDNKSQGYLAKLKDRVGQHNIRFVTCPSDSELRDLYKRASAVLFPPLNEDWGIVPLEGMAFSKVVVANNRGGPRESVVDGKTGWLLESTVECWAELIASFPGRLDELQAMGLVARNHVKQYDWSIFVDGIDDAIEEWLSIDTSRLSG